MSRAETLARIKAGEGFIYAARIERDAGPSIKIGFSLQPHRRVYRDLQRFADTRRCHLLGFIPASLRDELALHNALYGRRRCVKKGDTESYPLSIVDHPAIPSGLIWQRPDIFGPAPKKRARGA